MYETSGPDALKIANQNPARAWRGDRFTGDFFTVLHSPKFHLDHSDVIFTMGSCFAREVEANLISQKYNLSTAKHGIEPTSYESWDESKQTGGGVRAGHLSRGAFNKYTIASMTREIRRVLLNEVYEDNGLIELQPDVWYDPHAAGLKSGAFDFVSETRNRIAAATGTIRNASIVFLTLGLVEGWVDVVTGLPLVRAPTGRALIRLADRFKMVRPTFSEAVSDLESAILMIREICNPQMRFVLTVSPVPFHATFRPLDVVVANTVSKGLLRAAADEISAKYDFVDYFPSFEMVMNSSRQVAWIDDQLHVTAPMVAHVMKVFSEAYLK